jgi:hypothetical protein
MVAGKLAKLKVGGDRRSEDFKVPIGTPSLEQAADMLNVGRAKESVYFKAVVPIGVGCW